MFTYLKEQHPMFVLSTSSFDPLYIGLATLLIHWPLFGPGPLWTRTKHEGPRSTHDRGPLCDL